MKHEFESTVRGGLPVLVRASIYPAEPDVGIFTCQVDIDDICWLSGKPVSDRVYSSISRDDFMRLREEALDD